MKNKTQLISEFLYIGNHKRFEDFAEPSAIAYEQFIKKHPQEKFAFYFFEKVYHAIISNRIKSFRSCCVSDLINGTHFSFKKKGGVFVAGDRFVRPGKKEYEMSLHYFGTTNKGQFHGHIKFPLSVSQEKTVYLHDVNNSASTKIPKSKIQYKYEI